MTTVAILAEKPSQMRNFAKNFGTSGTRVSYKGVNIILVHALGHLYQYDTRDITKMVPANRADKYKSWNLSNLPWVASDFDWSKLVARSDVKDVLKNLKTVFSQVDEICIMTDVDPTGEGQVLGWEPIDKLGFAHKKITRAYFSDETDKAQVLKAFDNRVTLKPMTQDPEWKMGVFRQRWDFMSMQFSRITKELGDKRTMLPQGRLKSAIIRIVGDRLAEIKAYKKIPSYQVKFKDANGNIFTDVNADQYKTSGEVPISQFATGTVQMAGSQMKHTAPPALLTLSFLSSALETKGYKTDEVLATYQKMYQSGLVTYPRTEDKFVTPDQFDQMLPLVDKIANLVGVNPQQLTHRTPRKTHVKTGGVHGANRPGKNVPNSLQELAQFGPSAIDIYILLARNYLATLAPDYEYETQKANLKEYPDFVSSLSVPKKSGWKAIYNDVSADDEEESAKAFARTADPFVHEGFPPKPAQPTMKWLMQQLDKGSKANIGKKQEQVVKRTEQILAILNQNGVKIESSGIGTGATQAATYSELTKSKKIKGKVVRQPMIKAVKGKLQLTPAGQMSYELLPDTIIGSLELTELVYAEMAAIKAGLLTIDKCLDEIEYFVKHDLKVMQTNSVSMRKNLKVEVSDLENQKEREVMQFEGKDWNVAREWGGHRFTDAEWDKLKNGETIEVTLKSAKTGNPYTILGKISKQEFNGKPYYGFENLGFAPRKGAPAAWGGHTFTADEKAKLEAGETIYVEKLKSARTGNFYNANLKLEDDGNGGQKIVPSFG